MYRNILVPLDGSGFGEQALPYAIAIARGTAARVHVAIVETEWHQPQEPSKAAEYIKVAADYVSQELDESVSFQVLPPNVAKSRWKIAEVLSDYAQDEDIDLVIMTTHGRGPIGRSWMGSVADAFVRMRPAPVLLIRPRHIRNAAQTKPRLLSHIVVALDGSSAAERAVAPALSLAKSLKARVTLLQVLELLPVAVQPETYLAFNADTVFGDRERDARLYLGNVAKRIEAEGVEVGIDTVESTNVVTAIRDYARVHRAGIIAIGSSGWNASMRWLLGSVADKIVRSSEVPVLIVAAETGTSAHAEETAVQGAKERADELQPTS